MDRVYTPKKIHSRVYNITNTRSAQSQFCTYSKQRTSQLATNAIGFQPYCKIYIHIPHITPQLYTSHFFCISVAVRWIPCLRSGSHSILNNSAVFKVYAILVHLHTCSTDVYLSAFILLAQLCVRLYIRNRNSCIIFVVSSP